MPRWALLKHDTPDGDWHYDWLIERSPGDERLLTFRVKVRPDDPAVRSFDAHKLPDHRSAYLDFQGEVSGGRGVVARVGEGSATVIERTDLSVEVHLLVQGERAHCWLAHPNGLMYRFTRCEHRGG